MGEGRIIRQKMLEIEKLSEHRNVIDSKYLSNGLKMAGIRKKQRFLVVGRTFDSSTE